MPHEIELPTTPIDLRSDTVTRPSAGMLEAMMQAQVGDDVFGEDPTVNELERKLAEMFGVEAAIFCPTGTMANQIAIKLHTVPGEEVICEETSHVYIYEGGGIAFNSGCQVRPLKGRRGRINAEQVLAAINHDDIHKPRTALVCLENTSNKGGGSMYDLKDIEAISAVCKEKALALHLDGARLFNAIVGSDGDASFYGKNFDTISVCLSKGLGAPVGSVLLGSAANIKKARRFRKVLGGGMRQAGFLAAAGIYALDNNVAQLDQDHKHAKKVAAELIKKAWCGAMLPVDTNIIIFEVIEKYTAPELVELLAGYNILCFTVSDTQIRLVFHLDISTEMVDKLLEFIEAL